MERKETLMRMIEAERGKLNRMLELGNAQEAYRQSLVVDGLIEEYLEER